LERELLLWNAFVEEEQWNGCKRKIQQIFMEITIERIKDEEIERVKVKRNDSSHEENKEEIEKEIRN
jgi:hypothetical protein